MPVRPFVVCTGLPKVEIYIDAFNLQIGIAVVRAVLKYTVFIVDNLPAFGAYYSRTDHPGHGPTHLPLKGWSLAQCPSKWHAGRKQRQANTLNILLLVVV